MGDTTTPPVQQVHSPATNPKTPATYEELDEIDQVAVDLHIVWTPYKTIKQELADQFEKKITEQSIRRWFMRGGRLYAIATKRKQERIEERQKNKIEAQAQLDEGSQEAIGVIRASARGENISEQQLNAAKDILDRTGFPKTTKLDANGKFESEGLTVVAQGIKAILERRVARTHDPK